MAYTIVWYITYLGLTLLDILNYNLLYIFNVLCIGHGASYTCSLRYTYTNPGP